MVQDEVFSTPGPREGCPRRRRPSTTTEKLQHLIASGLACATGGGGDIYGSMPFIPGQIARLIRELEITRSQ